MTFIKEIRIADIISLISVLLVLSGGFFGFLQWRKNVRLKRAEYINELTEKIRTDTSIKEVIYMLEYDVKWYSREFHGSGELELKVDKTLSYFSYICYLKKKRILSGDEFAFFKYEVERILNNRQVQDYFYNLYHFSNKFDCPFTFEYLFKYGKKKKVFDEDFYDKNSYIRNRKYNRNVNF